MIGVVNFCGSSGRSYGFQSACSDAWLEESGVILFAAPDGPGWRAICVAEQGGADRSAVSRWKQARRFGATSVFVHRQPNGPQRQAGARDLSTGLDPVC